MVLLIKYHSDDEIKRIRYEGHVDGGDVRGTQVLVGKPRKRGRLEGRGLSKRMIFTE
jgi:hypothetical protein